MRYAVKFWGGIAFKTLVKNWATEKIYEFMQREVGVDFLRDCSLIQQLNSERRENYSLDR